LGVVTSAVSPFDLPISALAIGELIEILPSRTRLNRMPEVVDTSPLAATPRNSPVWVLRTTQRVTTMSPCAS